MTGSQGPRRRRAATITTMLALAWLAGAVPAAAAPRQGEPAAPAARPTYQIHRTDAAIAVDGRLDEAPWQGQPTFELAYETWPSENVKPQVETRFWMTYDAEKLYVAVEALDPEPGAIRARLTDRDSRLPGRLRRRRARHLQRREPRLRVLHQPPRRADGPPAERGDGQRRRHLGHHLDLLRPGDREGVRRRARGPLLLAPLPARRRRADLGHRRPAHPPARPAAPHRPGAAGTGASTATSARRPSWWGSKG